MSHDQNKLHLIEAAATLCSESRLEIDHQKYKQPNYLGISFSQNAILHDPFFILCLHLRWTTTES